MSDSDRKQRMISLRLSDEEYQGLKAHYRAHGARNISELARLALLSELEQRLRQVEFQVSLLVEREKVMS